MAKRLRCHCGGNSTCKLCGGSKVYTYEQGPLGWQPFRCPTCEGRGTVADSEPATGKARCPTCQGLGKVDPVHAPSAGGLLDYLFKFFMGA